MKKAILAVSFGTTFPNAERNCIQPIEDALRRRFPGCEVRRAYTSRMIIRKLRSLNQEINSAEEAIAKLELEGFEQIFIVPTHIIPGGEYDKVCAAAKNHPVSKPLLSNEEDLDWCADLLRKIASEHDCPLLLMGHGTEHEADVLYARLRAKLPQNVFLACLEGEYTLETVLPALEELPDRKLALMPLMLVAGSHANKNLAGESSGSWKSILEAKGFDITVHLQGLGALEAVQQRFLEKAARIIF